MAKIKHVAITCEDPDAVAKFYKEGFDLFEVARNARQIQLSDGDINLTILKWKTNEDADVGPNGENYDGIHHIGFQVDDLEETGAKLREINGEEIVRREVAADGQPRAPRAEEKWAGPNGQVLDISEPGWLHKRPMD
jgi:methylmalonyl-CoA/ethylmalonyl-CoA epimerase